MPSYVRLSCVDLVAMAFSQEAALGPIVPRLWRAKVELRAAAALVAGVFPADRHFAADSGHEILGG